MNTEKKILIVIQARSGSSRLPGKIFMSLAGKPLLLRMFERIKSANTEVKVVIATTTEKEDDSVVDLCAENGIDCYRGHETDLLDRHYKAAVEYEADTVVKIPSDCPLICPNVINKVLKFYEDNRDNFDYVSNLHPASYPDGNDVEIIPLKILETAWKEAKADFEREHTTPFIWERPDRFRIGNVVWETGLDLSRSHRFTIDYKEDYDLIKTIYDKLYNENKTFTLDEIIKLLKKKPELLKINAMHSGKYWYDNHPGRLKTV